MRAWSLPLVIALAGAGAGLPSVARAAGADPATATPVQREQAQARFLRGRQLFDTKKFEEALVEFRSSAEIVASPNSRLYAGRSLLALGRDVEAYVELGRTEVEARELARTDNRYVKAGEAAGAERATLRKRLAFVTARISGATADTRLVVGGEEIRRAGWSEPIPARPGAVDVRLETPGRQPLQKQLTLAAGETSELTMDAAAATLIATPAAASPAAAPTDERKASLRPYAIVAGAVGVVALGGFAAFGLMAKGTHDDLAARCPGNRCASDPASDADKGKTQQTLANVSLVVAGVALATGVTLLLAEPKRGPTAALVVSPVATGLRGTF